MTTRPPDAYPRRILLAVSGMSPQILTETLWALAQQQQPAFLPTEIHLVTTRSGALNAERNLLDPASGHYHAYCADYGLPAAAFDAGRIHVITDADGRPLDDIRTLGEAEAAADFITCRISGFTADADCALHVSLAGGRKTMGYYAGYALSLFGRVQDRLSHVLVAAPFEGLRDFYYPAPARRLIQTDRHGVLDAASAEVTLAEIPFVRLREDVPQRLLDGRAGFSETIRRAQRIHEPPRLCIDLRQRRVVADEQALSLAPVEFAFYAWMVSRQLAGSTAEAVSVRALAEPNRHYADEFLALCQRIEGEMGRDLERTEQALRAGMDRSFFDEKKSRVRSALTDQFGRAIAERYDIKSIGKRGSTEYLIPLEAEQIEWTE
jgi:CRISPR-associated protein (TIGR02584 family)